MSPFYTPAELAELGARSVGANVRISRLSRFYEFSGSFGDDVRIDDFCIIKGHVELGGFIHIAAYCMISGTAGSVVMGDLSTLAAYVAVYTATDDYSSGYLTNSVVPADLKRGIAGDVVLGKGVLVGAHSVLLPGTIMEDYATLGAQCIADGRFESGGVYVTGGGRPRMVRKRDLHSLSLREQELQQMVGNRKQ